MTPKSRTISSNNILHSFGVYDIKPNIYTAIICLSEYFKTYIDFFGDRILSEQIPDWQAMLELEQKMISALNEQQIIALSRKTAKEISLHYGLDINKIEVIHIPSRFELTTLSEAAEKDHKGVHVLGCIGSVLHAKGLVFLKEVLNKLSLRIPITVTGAIYDLNCINYLKEDARFRLVLNENRDIGTQFYRSLDCFVCLSIYESFSLSVLEAMSLGVPVVFSKMIGLYQDLKLQGLTLAALEDPRDTGAAVAIIRRILLDGTYKKKIIASGLKVARNFQWNDTITRYLNAYKRLNY